MMKTWSYGVNPFMVLGLKSFKLSVKISEFTNDKMAGQLSDPFIAAQYALYNPLHKALAKAYNLWVANGGTQKGSTAFVKELFKALAILVRSWDVTTQTHFAKGTSAYVAIWPHGRSDFNRKSIEERIGGLSSLYTRLEPYAVLAAVRTAVDAQHSTLDNARKAQEGSKGIKETASQDVEHAVIAAMTGMFAFYGAGISARPADPVYVTSFFDLATIRKPLQTEFANHCPKASHKNIFKRTMPPATVIKLTNTGHTDVYFYCASSKKHNMDMATAIKVAADESVSIPASALGYTDDNTHIFFNVANIDTVNQANFSIEIM